MNTIIFIGTHKSGSSREAIKAAEQLGYFTCLLTNQSKQLAQREEYPDVHLMQYCDLNNPNQIKETIHQIKSRSFSICGIVSFIDPWCGLAAQLASEFNVPNFTFDAIFNMESKLKSRELLKDTGYTPIFFTLSKENDYKRNEPINYPVVIKYVHSNGSKDVYFCKDELEYQKYIKKLTDKYPECTLLVEEYLDGPQYIIETLVINKVVHIVGIIEQEIVNVNGHFIITGYNLCLDYTNLFFNHLKEVVETIILKHQLIHGPCHLEMRFVNNQWKLIEINPRISGAGMNHLLKLGLGINLVSETLKLALDQEVNLEPKFKKFTFAEYILSSTSGHLEKVTGKNKALTSKGVQLVYIKPRKGNRLIPPVSLGNRYAYIIATGNTSEEAKENAKNAAALIQFHLKE